MFDPYIPFPPLTLSIKGRLFEMTRPWVMGILNVTPDSFHPSSRAQSPEEAACKAAEMAAAGADIIDVGACSTRPGSVSVSEEEELRRLEGAMEAIRRRLPSGSVLISVDTFRASVAAECLRRWDVDIINDVSGGADPGMFPTVARHGAAYVLMHSRGCPADMDSRCGYGDVVADVIRELAFRLNEARLAGLCNVIIDPGFGFAKTVGQNLTLLRHLDRFRVLGCPVLAGISRKRMTVDGSLASTIALNAVAIAAGASIIRVHDVAEGVATAQTVGSLWNLD